MIRQKDTAVAQLTGVRIELPEEVYVMAIAAAKVRFEPIGSWVRRGIDAVKIVRRYPCLLHPFYELPVQEIRSSRLQADIARSPIEVDPRVSHGAANQTGAQFATCLA